MTVDNHPLILEGIRVRLSGVKELKIVAEAGNGKEALALLEKIHVDVILMDVDMPVMNGFDAARAILLQFQSIKIIALTMFDEKSIIQKMLESGASGYLLKNVKKEELIAAILTVMQGNSYYSSEIYTAMAQKTIDSMTTKITKQKLSVPLSPREIEILKLVADGLTTNEIAKKLFISAKTVETHRAHLLSKINVRNIAGLIKFAIQNGLVE